MATRARSPGTPPQMLTGEFVALTLPCSRLASSCVHQDYSSYHLIAANCAAGCRGNDVNQHQKHSRDTTRDHRPGQQTLLEFRPHILMLLVTVVTVLPGLQLLSAFAGTSCSSNVCLTDLYLLALKGP